MLQEHRREHIVWTKENPTVIKKKFKFEMLYEEWVEISKAMKKVLSTILSIHIQTESFSF